MLQAELLIAVEDFPEARRAMGSLAETDPDSRVLTIMAAIARGEGADDAEVRSWMARAVTAPRAPSWVCDNCHNVQGDWAPVCGNCHSFDTLSWQRPPEQSATSPTGVEMMPLIVGAGIEAKSDLIVEDETVNVIDATEEPDKTPD